MSGRDRGGRGRGEYRGFDNRGRGGGDRGRGDRGGGDRGRGDRGGGDRGRGRGDSIAYRGGPPRGGDSPLVYLNPDGFVPPSSSEVTRVEGLSQKNWAAVTPKDNTLSPRRPGYGTKGREVLLWTNYFELIPSPDMVLYRYNVAVQPDAAGKKLNQIIRLLLGTPEYAPLRDDMVTDFKSTLISRQKLSADNFRLEIQYRAENEDEPRPNATRYRIRIEDTGSLTVADLTAYLTSTNVRADCAAKLPIIQALNIFLGHYAKSSPAFTTVGSSKSFSLSTNTPSQDLGAGLTALRGFFSSVRVATCRILVNVNITHGSFYDAIPLDQLIQKYTSASQGNRFKLEAFLKRLRVRVIHLAEKTNRAGQSIPRVKTIFGLATRNDGHSLDHPPRVKNPGAGPKDVEFWLGDSPAAPSSVSTDPTSTTTGNKKKGKGKNEAGSGTASASAGPKYISVYEFFRTVHKRQIANPALPVVNVGNRENPSYLPAEVCIVMPGQSSQKKLDPTQTQKMIRFAVRRPWENATSIAQDGPPTVGLLPQGNPMLARFGVSISAKLITVPGRVLSEPKIKYKAGSIPIVQRGSWNMKQIKFVAGATLEHWGFLSIVEPRQGAGSNIQGVRAIADMFYQALKGLGINAVPPRGVKEIPITTPEDKNIYEAMEKFPGERGKASLLIVVIPSWNAPLYNHIKHVGDVKLGVHTICVIRSKLEKSIGQDQYFANVALKVNLKLGGMNHMVDQARLGVIAEDKTMVVGIDVTHPSPGSASNAPSVAGMVASIDKWLGQWPADIRIQGARQEMVTELDQMLKSRLLLWKEKGKHSAYPENILVYRDGVSEGQYNIVLETELPLLRKACAELYPPPDTKKGLPRITIVVVGKRHHTRFYPTKAADADRSSNPHNGTVVDRGITEARNWDFFLQAHSALQGTARPAHYYVVVDEIFAELKAQPPFQNNADVLEDLTHNMCYLFGRATKAVSICPPAYYADIVCERARCYLSWLFDMSTPSQSVATGGGGQEVRAEDVLIHPLLRDTMFYI